MSNYFNHYLRRPVFIGRDVKADFPPAVLQRQSFYVNIVDYCAPAYPRLTGEQFATVAGIGFLYFQFYLSVDAVMDEEKLEPAERKLLATRLGYFEQAVADLGRAFADDSSFWPRFAASKRAYYEAGKVEKFASAERCDFTEALFNQLAKGKSALCNGTIHALDTLDGRPEPNAVLIECIETIHLAFQYRDDLDDFARDAATGQWTQAQYAVEQFLRDNDLTEIVTSAGDRHSALYTSEIATGMIERAIGHYRTARKLAASMNLNRMLEFLDREIRDCEGQIYEINLLLDKTRSLMERATDPRLTGEVPYPDEDILRAAADHATEFLLAELRSAGGWKDFMTTAGIGYGWVTGYVAMQLLEAGVRSSSLDELICQMQHDADWGAYNGSMQRDGDSTTFVIGTLQAARRVVPAALDSKWLAFAHPDGGWGTYTDPHTLAERLDLDTVDAVVGWLSPKGCVTAAAAYIQSRSDRWKGEFARSIEYLRFHQRENGAIPAYWWTSEIYPTAYALLALGEDTATPDQAEFIASMRAYILSEQTDQGFWTNGLGEACPFYTALAVRALLHGGTPVTDAKLRLAQAWLLKEQRSDGSWVATRKLKIPAPDVERVETVRRWRRSSFGTNVLVDDHNRYFTTATVLRTLHECHCRLEFALGLSLTSL